MTRSPAAFALSARLARREVLRRPGRTLLVALLVALPVAGMVIATVLVRTEQLSPEAEWRLWRGNADLIVSLDPASPALETALPPDARAVAYRTAWNVGIRAIDGERARAAVSDLPLSDPLAHGIVRLDAGRAPQHPGEIALSDPLADELGVTVGDTLRINRPEERELRITGIATLRRQLDEAIVLVAHGEDLLGAPPDTREDLVDLAAMSDVDRFMRSMGEQREVYAAQFSPELVAHTSYDGAPPSTTNRDEAVRWTWVMGGVVLTVAGIVISSAFAAGARRQLTTLGQLAANGAGPRVLRRTLVLQGTWTGLIGAGFGLVVAAIVLALGRGWLDEVYEHDVDGYVVRIGDLVPIVLIGVAAATIAALVPARGTSRIPVLTALAGRRPLGRVPRWLTVSGFVSALAGLGLLGIAVLGGSTDTSGNGNVWAATAILGGVAILLGACAIAPAYVSVLDHVAPRLGGPWRFAARSLARQRTRTGAVVSAVCATCALAIAVSALVTGATRADREGREHRANEVHIGTFRYQDQWVSTVAPPATLVDELRSVLPDAEALPLRVVAGWLGHSAVVLDDTAVRVYELDPATYDAIEQAGAALLVKRDDEWAGAHPPLGPDAPGLEFARVGYDDTYGLGLLTNAIVTDATVRELGLSVTAGPVVLRNPASITDDQRDALDDVTEDFYFAHDPGADDAHEPTERTSVAHYAPHQGPSPYVLDAVLGGVALVSALFVVTVSLALAAAETRDERDVLAVVGASPATMRRTSAHKAALLTVMGALLAIPVGFLPVVVFTKADHSDSPWLVFPWRTVALLVVAVPLVTAVVTEAASALALRLRPVRVSTMTFE